MVLCSTETRNAAALDGLWQVKCNANDRICNCGWKNFHITTLEIGSKIVRTIDVNITRDGIFRLKTFTSSSTRGNIENSHYSYDVESGTSECIVLNFQTGQVIHHITYTRSRLKLQFPLTLMSQHLHLTSQEIIGGETMQHLDADTTKATTTGISKGMIEAGQTRLIMATTTQNPKITTASPALLLLGADDNATANQSLNESKSVRTKLRVISNNGETEPFLPIAIALILILLVLGGAWCTLHCMRYKSYKQWNVRINAYLAGEIPCVCCKMKIWHRKEKIAVENLPSQVSNRIMSSPQDNQIDVANDGCKEERESLLGIGPKFDNLKEGPRFSAEASCCIGNHTYGRDYYHTSDFSVVNNTKSRCWKLKKDSRKTY